jgi:RND family efflux transporter MFP subunit
MNKPTLLRIPAILRGLRRAGIAAGILMLPVCAMADVFECLIEPAQVVELRSSSEGVIDKIYVQRGDNVKRGQVLVELESNAERSAAESAKYRTTMEGRILLSKNRVEFSDKKFGRSQELFKQNFVAAQARDDAETEKRLAESELKDALENQELARLEYRRAMDLLNRRTLRSPFDGVVVDRMLNPGDLAEYGTGRKPVMKLAQIDPLRVEVVIPVGAYGKLKTGMTGTVIPEGAGGRHVATVTIIDKVLDAASGTFGVRLELPNKQGALPGGVRCQVEFPQLNGLGPSRVAAKKIP